jgi:hypothetical protein
MTAGRLRAALLGVPDHAWVVCHDENGHWTPTTAEFLPSTTSNERAQIVLSDDETDNA